MIGQEWKKDILQRTKENSNKKNNREKDLFVKEYVSKIKKSDKTKQKSKSPRIIKRTPISPW